MLSALNQNQNFSVESPKRLSHFRYSLDQLYPQTDPNDPPKPAIPPLQRQNTLPEFESPANTAIIQRLQKLGAHSYGGSLGTISKIATKRGPSPQKGKNASQGSLPSCLFNEEDEQDLDNIYERISGSSQDSKYSVPLRKTLSEEAPARETKSLMVENDQYGTTRQVYSDEVIYAEPKVTPKTDLNKNSLVIENSFYASADVLNRKSENIYEDLDSCRPVVSSSQSSVEEKTNETGKKVKKSKSFIKRVWKRKNKKQEEKKVEEQIYAEVNPVAVEKVEMTDNSAIQMLSELQNILETKKAQLRVF